MRSDGDGQEWVGGRELVRSDGEGRRERRVELEPANLNGKRADEVKPELANLNERRADKLEVAMTVAQVEEQRGIVQFAMCLRDDEIGRE